MEFSGFLNRLCRLVLVAVFAGVASLHAQSNPLSSDAKSDYMSIKNNLLKSADKMSEENYSFRTTPQVRTYGEMIAHIADTQIALCSMVKGEPKKGGAASKTSKIDLSAAPFDYCDPVYDSMTDAEGVQTIKMFGHDRTKRAVLFVNDEKLLDQRYRRYIESRIREKVPYTGLPLMIRPRGREKRKHQSGDR